MSRDPEPGFPEEDDTSREATVSALPQQEHDAEIARLLGEHQQAIRGYVRALLPGLRDVSDPFQEVNLALWKSRDRFRIGTNFKAWAFALTRFVVLNYNKKLRREGRLVFDNDLIYSLKFDFEEESVSAKSRQLALGRCLAGLKGEDLRLLRHRYGSAAPLEPLAAKLGRSVEALRVRLHKVRIQLRRCIENRLREGES